MTAFWARNRALIIASIIILFFLALTGRGMPAQVWVAILLQGLTLGALFFLLAAGLSLIFGLMDVLNFAHGVLFMIGAYVGWTTFANPRLILNIMPVFLVVAAGAAFPLRMSDVGWRIRRLPVRIPESAMKWLAISLSVLLLIAGLRGFPLAKLVAFEATATGGAVPTAEAQEPLAGMLARLPLLFLSGLALGPVVARRDAEPLRARRPWLPVAVATLLAIAALGTALTRDAAELFILGLSDNVRFALAMLVGTLAGAIVASLMEVSLIRPLYGRPIIQIMLTLGLAYVGTEVVEVIWGPTGHPPMAPPTYFSGRCKSANLIAWLSEHCASVDILGRAFPTYRLLIIGVGLAMLVAILVLLRRSRLGMIIRAGVQDREMVEALGINVRRVFTLVFALGSGLAALGGVVAAPFLGVYPEMGLIFLLQAFIVVVVGGMGSVPGAAVGALLVGLARAFGDHLVTRGIALFWLSEPLRASPAIARASTVLVMALVLLVRPSGIFGKKE